jgi:hypothetical protein
MAMGFVTALRNACLDAINAAINGGAGAGKIRIYDGSRPATGGAVTNLLAELVCSDPAAAAAAAGVLTFSAITADASADATGTATWFRIVDSTNAFVLDGSVSATGGGGDLQLNTTSIVAGANVSIPTTKTITDGNP